MIPLDEYITVLLLLPLSVARNSYLELLFQDSASTVKFIVAKAQPLLARQHSRVVEWLAPREFHPSKGYNNITINYFTGPLVVVTVTETAQTARAA